MEMKNMEEEKCYMCKKEISKDEVDYLCWNTGGLVLTRHQIILSTKPLCKYCIPKVVVLMDEAMEVLEKR